MLERKLRGIECSKGLCNFLSMLKDKRIYPMLLKQPLAVSAEKQYKGPQALESDGMDSVPGPSP